MNKYKNQIPRTRDLVSSLVKLSPVLRLLLSPIFFFSHARCRMCVSLSSQRSSCIGVWFVARDDNACVAEPASRFERSSCEVDPPHNIVYIFTTTRLSRPHGSSISFARNGRTVFVVANVLPDERSTALVHFYYYSSNLLSPF